MLFLINELNREIEKYNEVLGNNPKIDWHNALGKFNKDSDEEEIVSAIICVIRARKQAAKYNK